MVPTCRPPSTSNSVPVQQLASSDTRNAIAAAISLGSAGFMGVGAFAAYNLVLRIDGMPVLASFVLASLCAALVGVLFGMACYRIKDFYLIVATLGSQFFIEWALTKFGWLTNYSASGVITAQKIVVLGLASTETSSIEPSSLSSSL